MCDVYVCVFPSVCWNTWVGGWVDMLVLTCRGQKRASGVLFRRSISSPLR